MKSGTHTAKSGRQGQLLLFAALLVVVLVVQFVSHGRHAARLRQLHDQHAATMAESLATSKQPAETQLLKTGGAQPRPGAEAGGAAEAPEAPQHRAHTEGVEEDRPAAQHVRVAVSHSHHNAPDSHPHQHAEKHHLAELHEERMAMAKKMAATAHKAEKPHIKQEAKPVRHHSSRGTFSSPHVSEEKVAWFRDLPASAVPDSTAACMCNCTDVSDLTHHRLQIGVPGNPATKAEARQLRLGFDAIYVVSLERRPIRRLYMDALLRMLGLQATVVPAVEKDSPGVHEYFDPFDKKYASRRRPNGPLIMTGPGEVACWFSHMAVWHDILEAGHESALILEDDVDVDLDTPQVVGEALRDIPSDWGVLWLGTCAEDVKGEPFGASGRLFHSNHPWCTHAYALHGAAAAQKLLQSPLASNIVGPLDEELRKIAHHRSGRQGIVGYSIDPPLVEQLPRLNEMNPSDVRDTTEEIPRKPVPHSARVKLAESLKAAAAPQCNVPLVYMDLDYSQSQGKTKGGSKATHA